MTKSQIRTQLSTFLVVIPYYLSLRYNNACEIELQRHVVIPYYLSLRYNIPFVCLCMAAVVIPYYLSLRYNVHAEQYSCRSGTERTCQRRQSTGSHTAESTEL